jgi:hypothetical protein
MRFRFVQRGIGAAPLVVILRYYLCFGLPPVYLISSAYFVLLILFFLGE